VGVAALLCRHGADVRCRDTAGARAVDVAVRCGHGGVADVLRAVEEEVAVVEVGEEVEAEGE